MKNRLKKIMLLVVMTLMLFPSITANSQTAMKIDKKSYIYTGSRKDSKFHTNKGYAFCITPGRTGPGQGTSLKYKSRKSSGGVLYLLEKSGSSDSEYLATQLAIWKYDSNYMPDYYKNHGGLSVVKKAKSLAAEAAKNKNYKGKQPSVKINTTSSKLVLTNDRKYYRSGIMTVNLSYVKTAKVTVTNAPAGTMIVDTKFSKVSSVTNNSKIYIQIPVNSVEESATITIKASSTGKVSYVERYATGNSKQQELVVLVKEKKVVNDTKKLTVTPIKRVCEIFNGKYYGKDGKVTTKAKYSIQCEKHTCEKVGNVYFGKDGKQVDKTTYSIQCGKHTCEVVGNVYFGKDGKQVDKTTYSIECQKHSCEKVGDTYFGKNGNTVTYSQYDLECNNHTCEKVGNVFFGKNGYEVDETTYKKECFKHSCEKVGDTYYGKNGQEVEEDTYNLECFKHTCEQVGDTYFGKDGQKVNYGEYTVQCEKHTCEVINGVYFGSEGTQITENEYLNQCVHTCEIYNNQYYGNKGKVVTEQEYKSQCEGQIVPVPNTDSSTFGNILSIILGASFLGTVAGIVTHKANKKYA